MQFKWIIHIAPSRVGEKLRSPKWTAGNTLLAFSEIDGTFKTVQLFRTWNLYVYDQTKVNWRLFAERYATRCLFLVPVLKKIIFPLRIWRHTVACSRHPSERRDGRVIRREQRLLFASDDIIIRTPTTRTARLYARFTAVLII